MGLAGEMSEVRVERRLAAIPAVDIAGYSRNLTGDAEQEYFVDDMVEEITTAIARLPVGRN